MTTQDAWKIIREAFAQYAKTGVHKSYKKHFGVNPSFYGVCDAIHSFKGIDTRQCNKMLEKVRLFGDNEGIFTSYFWPVSTQTGALKRVEMIDTFLKSTQKKQTLK